MQRLFRRKSEPSARRPLIAPGANRGFACFARPSSPPPPPRSEPEPPSSPIAAVIDVASAAITRLEDALEPGSSQIGEITFEKEDGGGGDGDQVTPSLAIRRSTPGGGPPTPAAGGSGGGGAAEAEAREWSTPPPSPVKERLAQRRVPTPVGETSAPSPPPPLFEVEEAPASPPPPLFEVEEAPPLPSGEAHARTDALPVAPITLEVLAAMAADAARALWKAGLDSLGAGSGLEAARILAGRARDAVVARVPPSVASRAAAAWAAVAGGAARAWERAVDWWAAEVEGGGVSAPVGGGSEESTAGSAPRASVSAGGGEDEDWEAVPPEAAVGWIARE